MYGKDYGDCCKTQGPDALGNAMQRCGVQLRLPGTRIETLSSWVNGDTRFRIMWNQLWTSPQEHTFHQFLDCLTVKTLGQDWFKQQILLTIEKQNAIVRWRESLRLLLDRPTNTPDGGHTFTGPVKAYFCLAYDLYWLQMVHKLPDMLIERLKDFSRFEGVRYEILIAAVFVRAGFEINWLDDVSTKGKHCEFIATHKRTGERIGVETKFKRRSAVLNFIGGSISPETHLKGDIFGLYDQAVKQAPTGRIPFLIFIDVNVPASFTGIPGQLRVPVADFPWLKEIEDELALRRGLAGGKTAETCLIVTNLPFYYGNNVVPSPTGMFGVFPSPTPNTTLSKNATVEDLQYCLASYGEIPRQI
jgi:hypothetical protein